MTPPKIGIIILAAGSSSRLGEAKQLLQIGERNLIQHVVGEANKTNPYRIVVVTGAYHLEIKESLNGFMVQIVHNKYWQKGMGSSIRLGIAAITNLDQTLDAVLLSVSDQPYITAGLFKNLIQKFIKTKKGIVASRYQETFGTPTLFSKSLFPELSGLPVSTGAKKLFASHANDLESVDFPLGYIDIDTIDDYTAYLKGCPLS
jgi:molybdenum cofactor cytidylyltransferase|tara:strand:- start:102 stop:710 length:609 start_codon:yes stop_codon:yes gene_type:complete